ncbi:SGNH/GDSL hydrolase family protein [Paenibacillus tengchongensis]|uniref:SGNH/GDSL hydrolase family protein n=1 Tax=Paenibacillus tengchongensis TaxID=2608684 RepID=UPI001FE2BB56|nr:SGNH/GDSL hydrolase family protein [Paenibacillus tengchongensis]
MKKNQTEPAGPAAPKDPEQRRNGVYLLYEADIEATARSGGRPSQEVYLDNGRLADKARYTGGVSDEVILQLLTSCSGLRKLVHSIGVSVKAAEPVIFVWHNWGRTSTYETGTQVRITCPGDGREVQIPLADIRWSDDDDVPGKLGFEFAEPGALGRASVIFYLNDGYEVPDIEMEPPVAFGSAEYQTMITRSLLQAGNNRRLKLALDKAARGEQTTIAYIGGSITQGAGAKPIHTGCYAYQSYMRLKELLDPEGRGHIRFVKAGVGGTPSELGVIRYERDVTRDGAIMPDIVVVEFAVNDEGDETKGNCYESLCRKILSASNRPAVILLFSVFVNDWNLQDRLSPVGFHYDLPMVSVKDAVTEQFRLSKAEGNVISKRQFFYDSYHPTTDGHRVMADCLVHLFAEAAKGPLDEHDIRLDLEPVIGNDYAGIRLLDRRDNTGRASIEAGGFTETDRELQMVERDDQPGGTPQFPYNWMHTPASGGESFSLTINARNLILVYKDSGSPEFGRADIYVDGNFVRTADPHENNWTHCNPLILFQHRDRREHRIEIRMTPGEEEKCFTILGFGYTE